MGRHKLHDRPKPKTLSLPQSVVDATDLALRDPLGGEPRYGLWSEVVAALLDKWQKGEVKIHIEPYRLNLEKHDV